jgi:hypothetical protein
MVGDQEAQYTCLGMCRSEIAASSHRRRTDGRKARVSLPRRALLLIGGLESVEVPLLHLDVVALSGAGRPREYVPMR